MRAAFVNTLVAMAESDPRILLLTGDLGFMALEPFEKRFPDRFVNVGVAEQDMVGIATGLAEAGFVPFVYSISTFSSLRPYEFIRNGPALHHLPVRIIGMGGGFEYGSAGPTHYGLEDLGVMRLQPGLLTIAPADAEQARSALLATANVSSPIYFRLGKDDKSIVPGLQGRFALGRAETIRHGSDLLMLSTGAISYETAAAADMLAAQGVRATVMVIASLNPPPSAELAMVISRFSECMTVEAHYTCGGLGSLVSEVIADYGLACTNKRCGVEAAPDGISGSPAFMHARNGISADSLRKTALQLAGKSRNAAVA